VENGDKNQEKSPQREVGGHGYNEILEKKTKD